MKTPTKEISARDRKFAVISFGVQLAKSTYTNALTFLEIVAGEAEVTKSSLLVDQVLIAIMDKSHMAAVRFANQVAAKAKEHGWEVR